MSRMVKHNDCCRCFRGSGQRADEKTIVHSKNLINVKATVSGLLSDCSDAVVGRKCLRFWS